MDLENKPLIDSETGLYVVYGAAEAFEGDAFEESDFEAQPPGDAEGPPLPFDFFVG